MEAVTIDRLSTGCSGCIVRMETVPELLQRLRELGFAEGCTVKKIMTAMPGEPVAFGVRGTVIALRRRECRAIWAAPLTENNGR